MVSDNEGEMNDMAYGLIEQLKNQGLDDEVVQSMAKISDVKERAIAVLKTVYDPEISVNIWDLGLIYHLEVDDENINIDMTLTAPACPIADEIPKEVKVRLERFILEVNPNKITVNLVWEPRWDHDMMTEEAKLILNMFF